MQRSGFDEGLVEEAMAVQAAGKKTIGAAVKEVLDWVSEESFECS